MDRYKLWQMLSTSIGVMFRSAWLRLRQANRIPFLVSLVALLAIIVYITANRENLELIRQISLINLVILLCIRLAFLVENGIGLDLLARKFGVKLDLTEWFGLAMVTAMGNYLTPFYGGMFSRAVYLKQRHSLPYSSFLSVFTASYLIGFTWIGLVGIAGILLVGWQTQIFYWNLLAFFCIVSASTLFLMFGPHVKMRTGGRIGKAIANALDGWDLIRRDFVLIAKLSGLGVVNLLTIALGVYVSYYALGSQVSFGVVLLIAMMATFSLFVGITPGNLGIQEAIISLSSAYLGVGFNVGILASLLLRAVTLLIVFSLGPVFSYILTHKAAVSSV